MITNNAYQLSAHEAASLVRPGGTILADIDSRQATPLEAVREAAIALATTSGAQLVLLDRSSASLFTDPYPSGPWTADVDGPRGDRALEGDELRSLGREALRRQVEDAARRGVVTRAWLARGSHRRALNEAVRRTNPDVVLLSADRPRSLLARLSPRSPDYHQGVGTSPVVTVDRTGAMAILQRSCSISKRSRRAWAPA